MRACLRVSVYARMCALPLKCVSLCIKVGQGACARRGWLLLTRLAALAPQLHNAGQSFQFWLVIEIASSAFNLVVVAIWVVICILHCDILESLMESHSTHSAHVCTHANAVTQMHASTRGVHPDHAPAGLLRVLHVLPTRACAQQTNKPKNARTQCMEGSHPEARWLACDGT